MTSTLRAFEICFPQKITFLGNQEKKASMEDKIVADDGVTTLFEHKTEKQQTEHCTRLWDDIYSTENSLPADFFHDRQRQEIAWLEMDFKKKDQIRMKSTFTEQNAPLALDGHYAIMGRINDPVDIKEFRNAYWDAKGLELKEYAETVAQACIDEKEYDSLIDDMKVISQRIPALSKFLKPVLEVIKTVQEANKQILEDAENSGKLEHMKRMRDTGLGRFHARSNVILDRATLNVTEEEPGKKVVSFSGDFQVRKIDPETLPIAGSTISLWYQNTRKEASNSKWRKCNMKYSFTTSAKVKLMDHGFVVGDKNKIFIYKSPNSKRPSLTFEWDEKLGSDLVQMDIGPKLLVCLLDYNKIIVISDYMSKNCQADLFILSEDTKQDHLTAVHVDTNNHYWMWYGTSNGMAICYDSLEKKIAEDCKALITLIQATPVKEINTKGALVSVSNLTGLALAQYIPYKGQTFDQMLNHPSTIDKIRGVVLLKKWKRCGTLEYHLNFDCSISVTCTANASVVGVIRSPDRFGSQQERTLNVPAQENSFIHVERDRLVVLYSDCQVRIYEIK